MSSKSLPLPVKYHAGHPLALPSSHPISRVFHLPAVRRCSRVCRPLPAVTHAVEAERPLCPRTCAPHSVSRRSPPAALSGCLRGHDRSPARPPSHSNPHHDSLPIMAALAGRKIFKAYNQDFIVDERWTVDKELGQGAYGIVWYGLPQRPSAARDSILTARDAARSSRPTRGPTSPSRSSPSRRSPMSSARRSWPSAPCAKSSCCSTSGATGTCVAPPLGPNPSNPPLGYLGPPSATKHLHVLPADTNTTDARSPVCMTWTFPGLRTSTRRIYTKVRSVPVVAARRHALPTTHEGQQR